MAPFQSAPKWIPSAIFGSQPLEIAVTWGEVQAVELLLDAGAAINAKHEGGNTALHHAIRMGNFGIARLADQTRRGSVDPK